MSLISNSSSALLAFQRALDTVGHNVANANTPGYSRQRVELANNPGQVHGFGFIGSGVRMDAVTRTADSFQFGRMLDSAAELGRLGELSSLSARIDKTFSDAGTGLAAPWSGFFDSAQAVASEPASAASRQSMLHAGEALAARFRSLDSGLGALEREVSGKLSKTIDSANQMLSGIAKLNLEITRQRALAGGQAPNDLLDQRERLAGELGGLLGVTTLMQDDGAMNVFLAGGQALVVGNNALTLATVPDEFRAARLDVALQANGISMRIGAESTGGKLRGLMDFRQDVLDPAAEQLGRMAATFVEGFNRTHREGVDLNGNPGGDFFVPLLPVVRQGSLNTGSGTLTATLADLSAFDGSDIALAFDGVAWRATSASSGLSLAMTGAGTLASPLRVSGVDVVVGGLPAAGDKFLLQPAAGAASQVRMQISDPSRVAAASPHVASTALANNGDARVLGVTVDDSSAAGFLAPSAIAFTSPTTYTRDGAGPFVYNEAAGISGAGWTLRLSGAPATGDTFAVTPRGPGSSDNTNARLLAAFDDLAMLDGGNQTLNGALAQVTVQAGFAAQHYGNDNDAQTIIHQQIVSERESTSGVNLDEEAANLMKFQQSYQAAAKMVSTADTLFQSLLAAVR